MRRFVLLAIIGLSLRGYSSVTVVQNVAPGATVWPGTPIISTMANPSGATTPVHFNYNSGITRIGQSFTITTTNYLLDKINLYAGGGTGTGAGTNLVLRLHDLGFQVAPEPSPYGGVVPNETIAADLLGAGAGLSITYTNQVNGVLEFDFSGSDRVTLQNGHMYVFELTGTLGTSPVNWFARTSGTYGNGAAYTNRFWLNSSSVCDLSMAFYGTPTTNLSPPAPTTALCTVNWTNVRQHIDGFGASSAWRGSLTTAQADTLFSTNTGIGLSLLRSRIRPPDGGSDEVSIMQQARDRGAKIWSTPWTPPTTFKNTNGPGMFSLNGGAYWGGLATNTAYASYLASYVKKMSASGLNIYAISVQNEPDVDTTGYESCAWNGTQIHDFVPFLAAALVASNVASTKIILPESQHWSSNPGLYTPTMNDPSVATNVSIVADHNYDGINADNTATSSPSQINSPYPGTALWETEVSALKGSYSSMYNGVYWAGRIHAFMTVAQANAWHHWWLISGNTTPNQGLYSQATSPTKRLYAIGNFSRFVRPDFFRIGVVTNSGTAVVSAYKDPASGAFAIVAINNSATTPINLTLNLTNLAGGTVTSVVPWITSTTLSLASQAAIAVSNSSFTYTLPGPGVVTFVGQVVTNNSAPTFTSVPTQTINAGYHLGVTNTASDPDVPPQSLSFNLSAAPGNATLTPINATNVLFNWRPLVSQAGTTNVVAITATDSGVPARSGTNTFSVIVNSITQPVINSINASNGQLNLLVDGMMGPDYTIWVSTNLVDWQVLFATNSPVTPFTVIDTNFTDGAHFYRVQIGP
jgi:glucuronoarabinoxylan endo-1,4-beta-xylanase